MLQNEKYKGDLLMQKWYTVDFLNKKQAVNEGKLDQFYVQGAHEPIISKEDWEAVQEELKRRHVFAKDHGIKEESSITGTALGYKVFCGNCGGRFVRKHWKGIKEPFWKCIHTEKKAGDTCFMESVKESDLRKAFTVAWNSIVEQRESNRIRWDNMIKTGSALERVRAKQMEELTAEGPLEFEIPELTQMVLQEITVHEARTFTFQFLDGTVKNISL